jgi:glycosyltransferase involved in cell wall biosynthesis
MRIREWLDECALALADRVTFISRSAANDVLAPDRRASARVIYNGLHDPGKGQEERVEAVDLLFVGTCSVRKRVELLPFVLARVRKRRPSVRMRLVGFHPDEAPELVRHARALGVFDAMVFEGRKRSDELTPFYRAARVLLVPSAYEGLPMVILEGFRNSLPCVATSVGGHAEVIEHGESGLLVDVDRPDELARAVLRIVEDPDLGRRMGERGRAQVAERFSVTRQVAEYLEVYQQMRTVHTQAAGTAVPGSEL